MTDERIGEMMTSDITQSLIIGNIEFIKTQATKGSKLFLFEFSDNELLLKTLMKGYFPGGYKILASTATLTEEQLGFHYKTYQLTKLSPTYVAVIIRGKRSIYSVDVIDMNVFLH